MSRRRPDACGFPGRAFTVRFRKGESIFTEASYKYVSAELRARVEAEGFVARRRFEDGAAGYALTLFEAVGPVPLSTFEVMLRASCVSG